MKKAENWTDPGRAIKIQNIFFYLILQSYLIGCQFKKKYPNPVDESENTHIINLDMP